MSSVSFPKAWNLRSTFLNSTYVAHFFREMAVIDAWDLGFREAFDVGIRRRRPIGNKVVEISASGAKNNDLVFSFFAR